MTTSTDQQHRVVLSSAVAGSRFAVSGRDLITLALFIVFYFSLKGGFYFMHNRMQEVAFLFVLILFVYSALLTALNVRDKDLAWSKWVFSVVLFIAYTMFLPAYLFADHSGAPMLPSVLASREFLISLLAPTLWFLYRAGYDVKMIEKVFLFTCGALVVSYIFHFYRIDLAAAFRSGDAFTRGMVSYSDWRG